RRHTRSKRDWSSDVCSSDLAMATGERLRIAVPGNGEVSALLVRPATARWLLVLGHGAGAGMTHPFLENLAKELAEAGVVTLRYQIGRASCRERGERGGVGGE